MATQQLFIEITADATGLTPGIEGIEQLTKIDKDIATSFDKTNTSLKARQALVESNNTSLAKFVQSLINANKAAIGDTYGKVLQSIREELTLTDQEAESFYRTIIQISEQSLVTAKTQEEIQTFNDLIATANTALESLGKDINIPTAPIDALKNKEQELIDKTKQTELELEKLNRTPVSSVVTTTTPTSNINPIPADFEQKVTRATTLLRNMRQELLVMEEQGIEFSEKFGLSFDDLSIKAARLQDHIGDTNQRIHQLSSETFAIDAIASAFTGLVAGANALSGAFILLGGDQQDVQQAILKTMAAMQLLNSLQSLTNLLTDQSTAKTGAQVLIKKLFTTTTQQQVVALGAEKTAQEGQNAATEQGTVAQTALNAAMLANPVGLLVAGLALLTAGIAVFAISVSKVTDAEEKEKAAIEAANEAHLKAADSYAKEEASLNVLIATAKDGTLTRNEQQAALDKAIKQYPEWLHDLTLENLYTKASSDAIAKQIQLIKERAFVQAAEDVYAEKLKKVAEAEANLNRIRTEGATLGDKIKGFFLEQASAAGHLSADELALQHAQALVNQANNDAAGAFSVVKTGIEGVSKSMQQGSKDVLALQENLQQLTQAALGLPPNIKVGIDATVKPFDPVEFDKEKAAALETAQYRIDVAKKGSAEEFAARRAYAELENSLAQQDVRLTKDDRLKQEGETLASLRDINQQAREQFFKDEIASAKAIQLQQEALGQAEGEAFFNARRDVLIKTAQEAKAQEGVTAGEIKQINAQLNLDLLNLEIERKDKALEIQKTLTQDRLNLAEKGSADELNAEIAILEIEKNVEINNAKDNVAKIKEINDRFRQQELDKILAFNQKVKQESDNAAIAATQHQINQLQLQGVADTNNQIVDLKKKLIEEEAQLEIDSIPVSGITEERRRDLIQGIYDKELADKKALEDAKHKEEIDSALKAQQDLLNIQKEGLNNLNNIVGAFGPARAQLNQQLFQNDLDNIKAERIANNQAFLDKLISQQQFTEKSKQLDDELTNAQIANAEKAAQAKIAAFDTFSNAAQKGIDFLFDGEKQKLEQNASDNQTALTNKLISQDEYNKRQKKLRQEEAAVDKQKAIFDILIDFAKQLFAIKAQAAALLANPFTAVLAPIALAQIPLLIASEAVSIGLIAAQKFKHGKVNIDGAGTETSDSIPARISKHESVITARATTGETHIKSDKLISNRKDIHVKHEELLTAMNEGRFQEYFLSLMPKFEFPEFINSAIEVFPVYNIPVMKDLPKWVEKYISKEVHEVYRESIDSIDYDKMGDKIGKRVGKEINNRPIEFGFDDNGLYAHFLKKQQQQDYAEKRRGFKK